MRHLFMPACLCLLTWSSSTGTESALEKFAGKPSFDIRANATALLAKTGKSENGRQSVEPMAVPIDDPKAPSVAPNPAPLPPVFKPVVARTREEICSTLAEAAQHNDLPVPFFIRLLFQESRFRPEVVSSAGAQGIAQFMPATATSMGLDNPFDPVQAIPASARLLRELMAKFGNLGLAAAAYNAGPKRIQDWLDKKGKLPEETQGYVKTITGKPAENWRAKSGKDTAMTVPQHAPCKEAVPEPIVVASADKAVPVPPKAPEKKIPASAAANDKGGKSAKNDKTKEASEKAAQPDKSGKTAQSKSADKKSDKSVTAAKSTAKGRKDSPTQQLAARKYKSGKRKSAQKTAGK